jgi:hypothetical protein
MGALAGCSTIYLSARSPAKGSTEVDPAKVIPRPSLPPPQPTKNKRRSKILIAEAIDPRLSPVAFGIKGVIESRQNDVCV